MGMQHAYKENRTNIMVNNTYVMSVYIYTIYIYTHTYIMHVDTSSLGSTTPTTVIALLAIHGRRLALRIQEFGQIHLPWGLK